VRRAQIQAQIDALQERQTRIVDALVDGLIDKPTFEQRKRALLEEDRSLRDSLESNSPNSDAARRFIMDTLELASTAQLSYEMGDVPSRRELALKLCSNRTVSGKDISVKPHLGLLHIAKREPLLRGAPGRNRTCICALGLRCSIH
jgi:site-specific DNA recombinase